MITDAVPPAASGESDDTATTGERRSGRRSLRVQRRVTWVVATLAAIGGAVAGCAPTGTSVVDPLLTGIFTATFTLAAARSKRWPLFTPVVVAVALARSWPIIPALAAAGAALVGANRRRRDRIWGSVTGALAVQALLRLPDLGLHGATAVATAAAVIPVLVSAYGRGRRHERRLARRIALGLATAVVVVGGIYGLVLLSVAADLEDAVSSSQAGLQSTRDGETGAARTQFGSAAAGFGRADDRLDAWWAKPVLAVPVAAQHARALSQAASDGRALSLAARETVVTADYDRIRYQSGRFDIGRIRATAAPLDRTRAALDDALDGAASTDSPWLLSPLAGRIDRFQAELDDAQREADLAADAIALAPDLLGANGPRRYFIAFVTPAELRGSGGFMGSWAEITAEDGRLRLTESGPVRELFDAISPDGIVITGPEEYLNRFGQYVGGRQFVGDFGYSPHFPHSAEVMAEMYPQVGGQELDGVISIDPVALAGLLALTGPIEVSGFGQTLTAENAAQFLLEDNYALFPDDRTQNDALAELVELTFDDLTTGDLPGPRRISEVLAPATREGRIRLWSPREDEEGLFAQLGATGAFPDPRSDHDFLALSSQNSGNNKIDVFQSRTIDYDVSLDGAGGLEALARITIRNDAPTDGSVPDYVIGNAQGDPLGTNRMLFSVHTPHALRSATLDGAPIGVAPEVEAGYRVYTFRIVVPPGEELTLDLELFGTLEPDRGRYVLDLAPHPTITPDELTVTVDPRTGEVASSAPRPLEGGDPIVLRP